MKIIHLSDLHIGKRVNEFSMIEDQKYILKDILMIIEKNSPDGIILAGDIYDKSLPSAEAVQLFDDFLFELSETKLPVFIISGNHDSAERLGFASSILERSNIYISKGFDGTCQKIQLEDNNGKVNFYLLPFIKPAQLKPIWPDADIQDYNQGVKIAIEKMDIDEKERNVLVTHQFVTGSATSESEELSVGGSDNVDGTLFNAFDYVALGHLHGPQKTIRDTIRYSGSPLKYSFSETSHIKSVPLVNLGEKGDVQVELIKLNPLRDMRIIKGTYMEVTNQAFYKDTNCDDYIKVILTDEEDIVDAISKLRTIYPNIMKLEYQNKRTSQNLSIDGEEEIENKSPLQLFSDFYERQNNQPISKDQEDMLKEMIEEIWGNEI